MTLYDEREVGMNNLKTLFGRKIKEYRKKKNLTQAQLAELVNVDDKHIGCIYYYEIDNKLYVNAVAYRGTHLINDKSGSNWWQKKDTQLSNECVLLNLFQYLLICS